MSDQEQRTVNELAAEVIRCIRAVVDADQKYQALCLETDAAEGVLQRARAATESAKHHLEVAIQNEGGTK